MKESVNKDDQTRIPEIITTPIPFSLYEILDKLIFYFVCEFLLAVSNVVFFLMLKY